jgi:hypothetical protein
LYRTAGAGANQLLPAQRPPAGDAGAASRRYNPCCTPPQENLIP